jgi:tRNA(fMet)-specific endonuclease VapC
VNAVIVDTNVISFYIKHDTRAALYDQHLEGRRLIMAFQTLAELSFWRKRDGWGVQRERGLQNVLALYQIAYPVAATCEFYAEARASGKRNGKPILHADAWIAAVALELEIPLVTHDPKDFAGVDGLEVISESNQ